MVNFKKFIFYVSVLFIVGITTFNLAPYLRQLLFNTGLVQEKILIAGTGSMYPTFPKGEGKTDVTRASEIVAWPKMRHFPSGINIFGYHLFSYNLQHGDIVDFENDLTKNLSKQKYGEEAGFVKRIIALPGDTISLRDGYTLLNGRNIDEPYTSKPRSTFGGDNLTDCQNLVIPPGKVFVMGDNRKASLDSRFELGLIDESDIKFVMPKSEQSDYTKAYRDTRQDSNLANTTTLDPEEFVRLINGKRKEKNLKPYKFDKLLSLSAKRRGSAMISADDFSTEATRSGVTMAKSLKEVGYRNIIFAEIFSRGFYEADELMENFSEFPQTKSILNSAQYQDIGLSGVIGNINNCPVQVVVVHLGGYVPPDYKQEDTDSWKNLSDNLNRAISSWEHLENADNVDKNKLNQLLDILRKRLDIADKIYSRMKANQWLTAEEEKLITDDKNLAGEANGIVEQLNKH